MKAHGIMFHHFHDNMLHIKEQGSLSTETFLKLLSFLEERYTVLPAEAFLEKARQDTLTENEVCLTFDDSLKCQYDIAYPLLKKKGMTAFWFLYTSPLLGVYETLEIYRHFRFKCFHDIDDFYTAFFQLAHEMQNDPGCEIDKAMANLNPADYLKEAPFYTDNDRIFRFLRDRVLGPRKYNLLMETMIKQYGYDIGESGKNLWVTEQEIKRLYNDGNVIGLHTHSHPTQLTALSYQEQLNEWYTNKEILQKVIGDKVQTASYPCNSYNADTISIMEQLEIQIAFKTNLLPGKGLLDMPREDHINIINRINSGEHTK